MDETEATPDPIPEAVIAPAPKRTPWTKPKPVVKRSRRHGASGRKWTWGYLNIFQPVSKWTIHGRLIRPTTRDTIPGCVYYAIKRIKRGSDALVHRAACEDGLRSLTRQKTYPRVQAELRLLARLGVIKRTKHLKDTRSKA